MSRQGTKTSPLAGTASMSMGGRPGSMMDCRLKGTGVSFTTLTLGQGRAKAKGEVRGW